MNTPAKQERPTYPLFVKRLAKSGATICYEMTPISAHLLHMAIGISGEAGELLDAIKKGTIYQKPLDLDNIIEELGDLEFYMEGLRQRLGISREATIEANFQKLEARYHKGTYSDSQAQERADKAPVVSGAKGIASETGEMIPPGEVK